MDQGHFGEDVVTLYITTTIVSAIGGTILLKFKNKSVCYRGSLGRGKMETGGVGGQRCTLLKVWMLELYD